MNIQFLINNQLQSVANLSPNTTLLQWLRINGFLGCKEGCAEGDCGACTVVLAGFSNDKQLQLNTINACITILPTLHGKAIFTVEYLRQINGSLHPVQQAMVDCHASQCGFCTPGFVMSLFALYHSDKNASSEQINNQLSGNLCRCTGYRPIIDAANKMYQYPEVNFDIALLQEKLTQLNQSIASSSNNSVTDKNNYFVYQFSDSRFDAPQTVAQLVDLRQNFPDATILAGGTDIGLWLTKRLMNLKHLIYINEIKDLQQISVDNNNLKIGAMANINDAFAALNKYYPQLQQMWERFASMPIRNSATLGGNVANGSPIGDSMPALIALGARISLASVDGERDLALEDFYLGYQQKAWNSNEVLTMINVPLPKKDEYFANYKIAKRFNSDISAICPAFYFQFTGDVVSECRFAFGGMAATTKRATNCEAALRGKTWNEQNIKIAMVELAKDFSPLSDMRASAKYRLQLAENLLYRSFLEYQQDQKDQENQLNLVETTVF